MKVLISAYSCEPGKGSEPGIGWNIAWQIAKQHEVWVLTRPDESGHAIEAELQRNPMPNLHIYYLNLPIWAGAWNWGLAAMQLHYYLWQIQAYFIARRLHKAIGFDLVHHVTFGRYSSPSFLSFLPIPFIWGPLGGGEAAPQAFQQDFSLQGRLYEVLRNLIHWLGEIDPFVRFTARRSVLALATTKDTVESLLKLGAKNVRVFSNVGLPTEEIANLSQYALPESETVRFISIGRLLHWKGFHLGLQAFATAGIEKSEYWIVGDGPESKRLAGLAKKLGVADKVCFWGALPRQETLKKLQECHVLIHPSLHDSGAWVCSEVMAAGRAVICLDLGGPAVQVTPETGFKISARTPEQAVCDLAKAMICVARDEDLRVRLGQAGCKRVTEVFDWAVKGRSLGQFYQDICSQKKLLTRKK